MNAERRIVLARLPEVRRLRPLALIALLTTACLAPRPIEPTPPAPSPSTVSPTPAETSDGGVAEVSAPPGEPPVDERCSPLVYDELAVLGPEFSKEMFVHDESRTITEQFVKGLSDLYAGRSRTDRCRLFTDRGLAAALIADPHLAAADRREMLLDTELAFRIAYEFGAYDLRVKPPRVGIDAIFDVPAGTRLDDRATGTVSVTDAVERIGYHLDFAYDGHDWRVDDVGPLSDETIGWVRALEPLPPRPRCLGFRQDAPGAGYDDDERRVWCDGEDRQLRFNRELAVITRYPCGGRATVLTIGRPLGAPLDPLVRWEYVRDPDDRFKSEHWLAGSYSSRASLPDDAVDTGWTNGNVDLWVSPSRLDTGIYLVRGKLVERWARAAQSWGVIDCN